MAWGRNLCFSYCPNNLLPSFLPFLKPRAQAEWHRNRSYRYQGKSEEALQIQSANSITGAKRQTHLTLHAKKRKETTGGRTKVHPLLMSIKWRWVYIYSISVIHQDRNCHLIFHFQLFTKSANFMVVEKILRLWKVTKPAHLLISKWTVSCLWFLNSFF